LRFLANWRGLIDIDSNLHVVSVPDALHPPINTIVMDAVNDAVRHGGADWVEIYLDDSGEKVVLSIRNNGTPPSNAPGGGVGGKTLDRLATAGWSREVDVLGFTRLRVEFLRP
jgi:signal transduction histidine kinase